MKAPVCRLCSAELRTTFVDLGMSPLSNSYLEREQLGCMEPFYPLHVFVCDDCCLVQLQEYERAQNIFSEYAYFSSYSQSWLEHARLYVEQMSARLGLTSESLVVEVASNDGYLLQYFVQKGIPVLGIDPAKNVAAEACKRGVPTRVEFFGREAARRLVEEGRRADLLLGNNVLAHVPDLHDFVAGLKLLLGSGGVITMEYPHLLRLIEGVQYDTIYHEHLSYLSVAVVERLFREHGLQLFDVEELATHGGSVRIFACHVEDASRPVSARVEGVKRREQAAGLQNGCAYARFGERVRESKRSLLQFLLEAKRAGKSIAGYGAPAKGNTLLNYCGIRQDLLDYTVDVSPWKQGRFLPGTHIPVHPPERLQVTRPDYVLILPWNLREEIVQNNRYVLDWGGRFVVPIPAAEVLG